MSNGIATTLGVGATPLASGRTFAPFLFRLFARLEDKVDGLARDHRALAREFPEFRGEVRARLSDLPTRSAVR
ncbi:MAG: hypothetical protein OXC28_20600 [Defluviicoccus sp.]|nr:hypothetical protein [Defluviicoccus sp.]